MDSRLLLGQPTWQLALVLIGGLGLISVAITHGLRGVTSTRRGEHHNEVLGLLFTASAALYAVLLAFVVFAVWEEYSNARRVVDQESATLVSLYLGTETFPQPVRNQAQRGIREYTASVIGDEFPTMQAGQGSADTERTLFDLFGVYALLHPGDTWQQQLDSASFDRLNQVSLLRNQRLQASQSTLPPLFWVVLVAGGLLTLALSAPLFMEHPRFHLLSSLLVGCTLGVALFLIFALNRPFTGAIAISPESFRGDAETYRMIDAIVAERSAATEMSSPAR